MKCMLSFSFIFLQKKELEAELVNVTGTAKPSRKIRYSLLFICPLILICIMYECV